MTAEALELSPHDAGSSEIDALVDHVKKWSPVANTFTRPVNLEVSA